MTQRNFTNRGFTLIEIAVVLMLIGLLASAIAVSSGGLLNGATKDEVLEQIGSLDAEGRALAKRLGQPVELHLETKRLVLLDPQRPGSAPLGSYALPSGYELNETWRMSRGEREESDATVVLYELGGSSETWGAALRSPNEEQQSKPSVIVVLGMTGQLTVWESDEQAKDILATALRRDAD